MEADSAPAPWLLRAPPCWSGDNDGTERARKRIRVAAPRTATRAEDTLRKYAMFAATKRATIGDWCTFVLTERGQPELAATVATLPHKAARLLEHLRRRGASVPITTEPWTSERLRQAAHRGSFQSAKQGIKFVCTTEMLEFCAQGFWTVLRHCT
jgi:hypothetical protein